MIAILQTAQFFWDTLYIVNTSYIIYYLYLYFELCLYSHINLVFCPGTLCGPVVRRIEQVVSAAHCRATQAQGHLGRGQPCQDRPRLPRPVRQAAS